MVEKSMSINGLIWKAIKKPILVLVGQKMFIFYVERHWNPDQILPCFRCNCAHSVQFHRPLHAQANWRYTQQLWCYRCTKGQKKPWLRIGNGPWWQSKVLTYSCTLQSSEWPLISRACISLGTLLSRFKFPCTIWVIIVSQDMHRQC